MKVKEDKQDKIMKQNLSAWTTMPSEGLFRSSKPIHIQKDDGLELQGHEKIKDGIVRYFDIHKKILIIP